MQKAATTIARTAATIATVEAQRPDRLRSGKARSREGLVADHLQIAQQLERRARRLFALAIQATGDTSIAMVME